MERILEERRAERQKENPTYRTPRDPKAGAAPAFTIDDELDRRVRKAVEISEKVINRSPSKYKHNVLDSYIHTYIKKDPLPEDQPLLYSISPFLKMQPRLVPTLKIYSQDNVHSSQYRVNDVSQQVFSSGIGPNSQIAHDQRVPAYQTGSFGGTTGNLAQSYGGQHHAHEPYGTNVAYTSQNLGENVGQSANYTSSNYGGVGAYGTGYESKKF